MTAAVAPEVALFGLFVAVPVALLLPLRRALLPRIQASARAMLGFRIAFAIIPVLSVVALREDLVALF